MLRAGPDAQAVALNMIGKRPHVQAGISCTCTQRTSTRWPCDPSAFLLTTVAGDLRSARWPKHRSAASAAPGVVRVAFYSEKTDCNDEGKERKIVDYQIWSMEQLVMTVEHAAGRPGRDARKCTAAAKACRWDRGCIDQSDK
jgi:hypothetical protein